MSLNRALITFGDKQAVMNINNFRKINDHNIQLTLTDGSSMVVHPNDVELYDRESEVMGLVEDSMSPIHIDATNDLVEFNIIDKAIIQRNDKLCLLDITDVRQLNQATTSLTLADGTELYTNPMNVKLYNSKSPVMKQVEDGIVMFSHQRIQSEIKPKTVSI